MKNGKRIALILSLVMTLSSVQTLAQNVQAINMDNVKVVASETQEKELKAGQVYNGFKLVKKHKDYKGNEEFLFEHEKSGAKLYYVDNGSEVRAFSIGFKTPIENSKGIPHILEHAFLAGGTEKYPVKQLVKELGTGVVGGSLNGYTFADSTQYPFSTINENDFNNMMDVYMDMIFNPLFIKDDRVFDEEAWHYSIENKEDELKYSGVVYNEMKGRAYGINTLLYNNECKMLFPDTFYKYNSGGDINEIPKLTAEEVKEFYKKYYTGSNSHIVMVGKMDILDKLARLDKDYLNNLKRDDKEVVLQTQTPFTEGVEAVAEYPVGADESIEKKTILSMNYVLPEDISDDDYVGLIMIVRTILNNQGSAFDQAMKQAGLTVQANIVGAQVQKYLTIRVMNTDEDKVEEVKKYIADTLNNIIESGLNKDAMNALINSIELSTIQEELKSDTSVSTRDNSFQSWMKGDGPLEEIDDRTEKEYFDDIRKMIDSGAYEGLIKKYILDNNYNGTLILKPVQGMLEREAAKVAKQLKDYKDSLSDAELEKLIKKNKELKEWMEEPVSKKLINELPKTDMKEIDSALEVERGQVILEDEYKVLYNPIDLEGVNRIKMYFDADGIPQDDVQYVALFKTLIGNMDTENYSYTQLPTLAWNYTDGYSWGFEIATDNGYTSFCPQLTVTTTSMNSNAKEMFGLLEEIMLKTNFDNKELLRLYIGIIHQNLVKGVLNEPINVVYTENSSTLSNLNAYNNELNGVEYINFLADLEENFDEKYDEIIEKLNSVRDTVFSKFNMVTSISINEKEYDEFKTEFLNFARKIDNGFVLPHAYKYDLSPVGSSIPIQAKQQYNVQSFNFADQGIKYSAEMDVLSEILRSKYLWDKIRISGGAYGAGINMSSYGSVVMYSYRDSQIKNTFEVFDGLGEFIRNLDLTDEELLDFKRTALSRFYKPYSKYDRISISDTWYFSRGNNEIIDKRIKEVTETTVESLRKYADMFDKGLKEDNITTIGNPVNIEENKELYEETIEIK